MSDIIARGMAGKALKEIADIGSGGGGEPDAYIKSASVSGNTLTLTNKDDTTVDYNGAPDTYVKSASVSGNTLTLTNKDDTTVSYSGEPSAYLKNASVSNNTLTITNKDDTTVVFTPSGGITEERVNELIDAKLNAIPNAEGGAY